MSEIKSPTLSGVSETLLITLYLRAMEAQRPDAVIKDEKAVALVAQMSYDFARVRQIPLSEANKLVIILRNREFDRYARDFLARHPEAVVVHIGCGLDSRFERVAERNGRVEWYDLDLPDVIALRRKYLGDEGGRYHPPRSIPVSTGGSGAAGRSKAGATASACLTSGDSSIGRATAGPHSMAASH